MSIDPISDAISDYWNEKFKDNSAVVPRSAVKRFCMTYWKLDIFKIIWDYIVQKKVKRIRYTIKKAY